MIGVVIPYHQRMPGLLNRALASVARQSDSPPLRVYVVDDGSPAPAERELEGLPADFLRRVSVFRQPNRGPGAARNAALARLPPDVEAVAFLDSDDAWSPEHLQRAATALRAGADFYFADHRREEDAESRFSQCRYAFQDDPGHPRAPVRPGQDLYWCEPRSLLRAIVERSPVGTSTVVIRRCKIAPARFPTRLRTAGEDSLFWLDVLCQGARPACSLRCEAAYGRGVSIFNHRSWGDARSLRTTLDEMRAQGRMRERFRRDAGIRARAQARCRELDRAFCASLLACGRRLHWRAAGPALQYLLRRPRALLDLPAVGLEAGRRRRAPAPAPGP